MLLLREVVYPYEYVDERETFNETPFPQKEEFYRNLNVENITNVDYMHAKRVCKDFEIKDWNEYIDLYLKSDKLSFKICFTRWISLTSSLKETKLKLELLTDIDMLLMVEKWTRGWIFHSVNRNANPNNKYMEDGDKNKESSYLNYWDVNNSDGWAMSQKSPFGAVNARTDWNINIRVFVWLYEIELWRKSKTVFHEYRKFHCVQNIDDIYKAIAKDVKQELTLQVMSLKDHY